MAYIYVQVGQFAMASGLSSQLGIVVWVSGLGSSSGLGSG